MPLIDPNSITIADRQREDLGDLSGLVSSIKRYGQINAVVVTKDHRLIAGERRTRACQQLGIQVEIKYAEDLSPHDLRALELEENAKRKDLSWQETSKAVTDYHNFHLGEHTEWSQADTARELNLTQSYVSKLILVRPYIDKKVENVAGAATLAGACNVAERLTSRAIDQAMDGITLDEDEDETEVPMDLGIEPKPKAPPPPSPCPIIHADFTEWVQTYSGPKFNLIHLDFPYGIDHGESDQGGADAWGGYDDKPAVYHNLVHHLLTFQERFIAPKAHIICWLSFDNFFEWTKAEFLRAGFDYRGMLYWHKTDNRGIISDPNQRPRNIMETAIFFSRGGRRIIRPVANTFGGPCTKEIHLSEKPEAMLHHFFRMLVDEFSAVLDPTCGSGTSIRAAKSLNANRVLGLEKDPEMARLAQRAYRKTYP